MTSQMNPDDQELGPVLAGHAGVDQRLLRLGEVDPGLHVLEPVEELRGDGEDRRDEKL